MQVTDPYTFNEINLCITWNQYPSYDSCPSNSLQEIRQNLWIMKYRSVTYIINSGQVCVPLNQHLEYNVHPSTSLQDMSKSMVS